MLLRKYKFNISNLYSNFYLFLLELFFIFNVLSATRFNGLIANFNHLSWLVSNLCIYGLIGILPFQKNKSRKVMCFIIIGGILMYFLYLYINDRTVLLTYLFVSAYPNDLSVKKIAKFLYRTCFFIILITIVSSKVGVIEDYTFIQRNHLRHSFGFTSSNALANIYALGVFFLVYSRFEKWSIKESLLIILISLVIYYYTRSRMSIFLIIVYLTLVFLAKKDFWFKTVSKIIYFSSFVIAPVGAVLSIGATVFFSCFNNEKIFAIINSFFTGRLHFMTQYFNEYGIHFFGQNIRIVSLKESLLTGIPWSNVDNSYLFVAIRYGGIILISFIILNYLTVKYLKERDDIMGCIYIIIICFYGLTENFILMFGYNLGLLFFAESLNKVPFHSKKKKSSTSKDF